MMPAPPSTRPPQRHDGRQGDGPLDRQLPGDFVIYTQDRTNGKNYNASADYFWLLIFSVDCRLRFTVVQITFFIFL